jgi:BNR/Asp-box repeat
METRDRLQEQGTAAGPGHARSISRGAAIGTIFVVLLVIGASALVFAQLSRYHQDQATLPPGGKWVQVLNGYTPGPPIAGESTPSTLYACAAHGQNTVTTAGSTTTYTVLRSTDFGTHWQDVGSKAGLGISCQLTVNPGDSNEVFVVTYPRQSQGASILKHSTDGGQTWETLQPTLKLTAGTQSPPAWSVQVLRMVGSSLFGLQWLPFTNTTGMHQGPVPHYYTRMSRLVTSSDGGHSWTVLDQQLSASGQSVYSYAVDPIHSGSIYELVSKPWLPVKPGVVSLEPNDVPPYGGTADLYKTTDNGASWHLLLQHLPFGTQVYLAGSNPQWLYVGGVRQPMPYLPRATDTGSSYPGMQSLFNLQVSNDGGASWSRAPDLSPSAYLQTWLVAPGGQVYVDTGTTGGYNGTGGQATAVAGTPGTISPATPQSMAPYTTGNMLALQQPVLTPPPSVTSSPASIQRYDPTGKAWQTVTTSPSYGTLLCVTAGNGSSDVLWFMGSTNEHYSLYRYVI